MKKLDPNKPIGAFLVKSIKSTLGTNYKNIEIDHIVQPIRGSYTGFRVSFSYDGITLYADYTLSNMQWELKHIEPVIKKAIEEYEFVKKQDAHLYLFGFLKTFLHIKHRHEVNKLNGDLIYPLFTFIDDSIEELIRGKSGMGKLKEFYSFFNEMDFVDVLNASRNYNR